MIGLIGIEYFRALCPVALLCALGCAGETASPKVDSKLDSMLVMAAHRRPPDRQRRIVPYDIMREWHPTGEPNGYGADLIISPDATETDVIDLVESLARGHDPVFIGVYLSEAAYDDSKRTNPSEVFGDGFVGAFVRNLSSGGAYRGANEFRWMQERGRFANKTGQATRF
jgi:hypothetical protein